MYSISKQFSFSAAHSLRELSPEHPCTRLHGHNYVVTVHLKSEQLNETGFVCDYKELEKIKEYIDTHFDHQNLNDLMFPLNPSAENLAKMLYDIFKPVFPQLYAVEVSETPKTSALYEPEGE